MKYKVIVANSVFHLEDMVNAFISRGWIPQGGVAVWPSSSMSSKQEYYQAVTKSE